MPRGREHGASERFQSGPASRGTPRPRWNATPRAILLALLLGAVLGVLLAILLTDSAQAQMGAEGSRAKASFLLHLPEFVEWPASNLPGQSHFEFCLFGDPQLAVALSRSVAGRSVQGKAMVVRLPATFDDAKGCQVVFLGSAERKNIAAAIATLVGSPALPVGDLPGFSQDSGTVEMTAAENGFRLAVNQDAAEHNHFKFSSRLLSLARIVRTEKKG